MSPIAYLRALGGEILPKNSQVKCNHLTLWFLPQYCYLRIDTDYLPYLLLMDMILYKCVYLVHNYLQVLIANLHMFIGNLS